MKKTLKLVASAALIAAVGIPATACSFLTAKNVEKISPMSEYTHSYNASLKQSNWTVNTDDSYIEFIGNDRAGTAIVRISEEKDGDISVTYRLFNLATASLTNVTSEDQLSVLDKGLFYSVKTTDTDGDPVSPDKYTYTLYSANSALISNVKGTVNTYTGIFTQENGTRWYVDYNGTVQQETDPFAMLFTDYDLKVADKYISAVNDGSILIYNEDGEFEKAFSIYGELKLSEDVERGAYWMAGDSLFMQVIQPLPADAEKYDFISEDEDGVNKYDLNTYSYSVKKDKIKELKDFNYLVEYSYLGFEGNFDYAILEVCEIVDNRICDNYITQSFDENGNVYFDIQKLVPGAEDISYCGDYVLIYDAVGMTHVYKEKELVMTIPANSVNYNCTDSSKIYYTIGSTLYIYDLSSQSVVKSVANVSSSGETEQGNIWYTVYDETSQTTQCHVYNVNTGAVTLEKSLNAEKQSMYAGHFGGAYCIISSYTDDGTTYTLSFPDSSIDDITSKVGISVVNSYYAYSNDGMSYTEYTVFCVKSKNSDKDTINSYYVLTETSTTSAKE